MNLSEEFVLLAYGDDGKPVTDGMHLDNGLGGSLLLELALAGRIDIQDKRVLVRDESPTGDTEIRSRLRQAVSASGAVEARTAALCALVAATGLERKVFADLDRKRVKVRLKEIGEGSWVADAVRQTIRATQAAIAASSSAASGG
jgi:Golgi phosphoprotein 3 (GPP34)